MRLLCFAPLLLLVGCSSGPSIPERHLFTVGFKKGEKFSTTLKVQRDKPEEVKEIRFAIEVRDVDQDGNTHFDACVSGLTLNGKDRDQDVEEIFGDDKGSFTSTKFGRPAGQKAWGGKAGKPDVMKALQGDAAVYGAWLPDFEVKEGEEWDGSSITPEGCKGAVFHLKQYRIQDNRVVADLEATELIIKAHEQLGPMKMVIDVKRGFPIFLEYSLKEKASGRTVKFTQHTDLPAT